MNSEEFRVGLKLLTKEQLVSSFPDLELKSTEKKDFIIEAIVTADPMPAKEEITAVKCLIADFTIKKIMADPSYFSKDLKGDFIVVSPIVEDDKNFQRGDSYTGKHTERFLERGKIRRRIRE